MHKQFETVDDNQFRMTVKTMLTLGESTPRAIIKKWTRISSLKIWRRVFRPRRSCQRPPCDEVIGRTPRQIWFSPFGTESTRVQEEKEDKMLSMNFISMPSQSWHRQQYLLQKKNDLMHQSSSSKLQTVHCLQLTGNCACVLGPYHRLLEICYKHLHPEQTVSGGHRKLMRQKNWSMLSSHTIGMTT